MPGDRQLQNANNTTPLPARPKPKPLIEQLDVPPAWARQWTGTGAFTQKQSVSLPPPSLSHPSLANIDPSPAPASSFHLHQSPGQTDPANPSGAVGPDHIVTLLNGILRVHTRTGDPLESISLDEFFSTLGPDVPTFDGRCIYEPYSGRWIIAAAADPLGGDGGMAVALSGNSDALGSWHRIFISLGSARGLFADGPVIGFNRHWIVIQANLFQRADGTFAESQVIAVDKSEWLGGAEPQLARFRLNGTEYGGSQIPAVTYDGLQNELHLVKNWIGNYVDPDTSERQGFLRVFTLSGTPGEEVLDAGAFVSTLDEPTRPAFVWADANSGTQGLGRQNGTSRRLDLGDSRIQNVFFRGTSLWCSQTVLLPAAQPTRAAVQWWEVFPDGRLFQRHLVDDSSGAWSYAYPSIAVNNNYDVLLGYSGLSASVHPSAYYRLYPNLGVFNDPLGERLLKSGEGTYQPPAPGAASWGRWSSTCIDPWNDGVFWTLQSYTLAPGGGDSARWGTVWGAVIPSYDLQLKARASKVKLAVGESFEWTLTLSNRLRSFGYNAVVRMPVPVGVDILESSTDIGTLVQEGDSLYWDVTSIGQAAGKSIVRLRANGFAQQIQLFAEVFAFGEDSQPGNNTISIDVSMADIPPLVPPNLQIGVLEGGGHGLAWPVGYLGFRAEQATSLAGPWKDVSSAPILSDRWWIVPLPSSSDPIFFRLRR